MKSFCVIAASVILAGAPSPARAGDVGLDSKATVPAVLEEVEDGTWSFSSSLSGYVVPDDHDYLAPLFTADREGLHLEARYNYEALDTASAWIGYNMSIGEKWVLDFTPMIGGVFGDTQGVAPGWRIALSHGALELTSEAEFMFDAEDSSESFFYAWTELTWSFTDCFWAGLALQRTRAYKTDLDIQRGFLLGLSIKGIDFTGYVFNWGVDDPLLVFSIGTEF